MRSTTGTTPGQTGSFYVVLCEKAVELSFSVGDSGVANWTADDFPTDRETFVQGLVVMVVEETEGGNLTAASKAAGLLADLYAKDVLILDAQFNMGDMLVGEIHFVDGPSFEERREKAHEVLDLCMHPAENQLLH